MSYYNYGAYQFPNTMIAPQYAQPQNPFMQPQVQNCLACENRWMWIHGGREAAKSYPQAPNTTMLYMDDENAYEYFRKTDNEGRTVEFKVFPLKEEEQAPEVTPASTQRNYISKEEFDNFSRNVDQSLNELKDMILSNQKYNKSNNYRGKQVNSNA